MPEPTARDDAQDIADLGDEPFEPIPDVDAEDGGGAEPSRRPPRSLALRLAAVAAVALLVGAGLLVYRAQHRRKVVAAGLARAEALLRLDTAAGFREAASLLEPLARIDPVEGASARAFALAMLAADYREQTATEVEALLVAPGRAELVPAHAQLAAAALALGRGEAGNATTALSRAGGGPWALALQARVALLAGNVRAAREPAAAAAAHGAFPAGLAVHGDVLRRLGADPGAARAAYAAALAASPLHPRSAYGLAKLALAGDAPAAEASRALERLLADRGGTPAPERARAALHLASLRLRAGDRAGAAAALDGASLEPAAREWAERAAAVSAGQRGRYRAVAGAPPALRSPSDDDPGEISPVPPPPPGRKAEAKRAPAKRAREQGAQAKGAGAKGAAKGGSRPAKAPARAGAKAGAKVTSAKASEKGSPKAAKRTPSSAKRPAAGR